MPIWDPLKKFASALWGQDFLPSCYTFRQLKVTMALFCIVYVAVTKKMLKRLRRNIVLNNTQEVDRRDMNERITPVQVIRDC